MNNIKSILASILTVGLFSYASAVNVVRSGNIVGYVKVTVPANSFYLGACNFKNGETNHFEDVFGTDQLNSGSRLSSCEVVYLWNPETQTYFQYAQYNGETYSTTDWKGSPTNPVVSGGFFIESSSDSDHTLTFSGAVVSDENVPVTMYGGGAYTLVCYPFSSDIAISDLNIEGATSSSRLASADLISVWDTDHYNVYGLSSDGNWYSTDNWKDTPTTDTINLGQGFWYYAQNPVEWSATNIYYDAINK